jgi:sirohydrochlorin cobaltochelatase
MTTAILLFAHGSRDPNWRRPIEAVALEISQRQPAALVRCAYLELCLPSLPDAADDVISAGASKIKIFPLFLGVGKHAREDLPELVDQIRASYPGVPVELLATAGESPALIALMADIALA